MSYGQGEWKCILKKKLVKCLDSLIISFEGKERGEITNVYAHSGDMELRLNNFIAYKNVSVISSDGKALYTDTLYYNSKKNKLYSETNMMFVMDGDTTWGTSFESDTELQNIFITNQSAVYSKQ